MPATASAPACIASRRHLLLAVSRSRDFPPISSCITFILHYQLRGPLIDGRSEPIECLLPAQLVAITFGLSDRRLSGVVTWPVSSKNSASKPI